MNIEHHIAAFNGVKEQLKAAFPDVDDADLLDTVDGGTSLTDALVQVMRKVDDDKMLADGIKARVAELSERKQRLEARQERMREIVRDAMERAGLRKIEAPDFTLSLGSKPRSVVVSDEAVIPHRFWKVPAPVLDKKSLADDLKAGADIPGAELSNGGVTLSVRRK